MCSQFSEKEQEDTNAANGKRNRSVESGEDKQSNRCSMPNYLNWLKKMLPLITLWGNLCVGNLKR